ncbi:hypothetical protein D3C85_1286850 [compost metagenome]
MLDCPLFERDSPVRVVVTNRCWDQEATGQLGVDHHVITRIQLFDELPFDIGIRHHIVVDMPPELLSCLAEVLLALAGGEDIQLEFVFGWVIGQVLDNHRGLLFVDKTNGLSNKVFWIGRELSKYISIESFEHLCDSATGKLRSLC